jgi:hypothetical protein
MKQVGLLKLCLNETHSKVRKGKYMSEVFPVQNGLKQGDPLLPLLFNFALDYTIKRTEEKQERLELNGTHQLLVSADDVNLLRENMGLNTIKKNPQALLSSSKGVGLQEMQ